MMTMTREEKRIAAVKEALQNMSGEELRAAWNEYARENDPDSEILDWDEFDELFGDQPASWIVNRIYYGDYNPGAEYFKLNGYGNIQSIYSYELAEWMGLDECAEWYANAPSWAWIPDEIAEALEEFEEE